jgi:hypothetical protein
MTNSVRHTTGNVFGLMATPPCVQDNKLRIKPGTVNVAIGRATGMPKPCEFYATPDADTYAYDCLYDPKQISLADAEKWVRNQLAEQGVNVGRFINEDKPADDTLDLGAVIAAMPDAIHEAMRKTLPHKYTPELADAIAASVIANLAGDIAVPCPVFRDCADTTPGHYDHFTHDTKVLDDTDGSTILDAGMVANSGSDRHVIVYLRNAEFTDLESVRAKTAEVRAFLDGVDELADRVFADQQARTEQAGGDQ